MTQIKVVEQQCQARTNFNGAVGEWHKISAQVYENRMRHQRRGYEIRVAFVVVAVVDVVPEEPVKSAWPKSFYETGKHESYKYEDSKYEESKDEVDKYPDDAADDDVFRLKPKGE